MCGGSGSPDLCKRIKACAKGTTTVVPFSFGTRHITNCRRARALMGPFSVILKNDQRTRLRVPIVRQLNMTHSDMIRRLAVAVTTACCCLPALSQDRIYRCGNEYTNDAEVAKSRGCKPMDGGNITIIQGTSTRKAESKPAPAPRAVSSNSTPRSGTDRVEPGTQRARDSDARLILEAELRKAQERLAQANKAYANGAPDKEGIEFRNHQRYLDRVAELKANVERAESDVSSIQRELARFGASKGTTPTEQ